MDAERLRRQMQAAISLEWPAFQERHPNLAEVIDEDLLLRQTATRLADDASFVAAMRAADAAGLAASAMIDLIRPAVRRLLRTLN